MNKSIVRTKLDIQDLTKKSSSDEINSNVYILSSLFESKVKDTKLPYCNLL